MSAMRLAIPAAVLFAAAALILAAVGLAADPPPQSASDPTPEPPGRTANPGSGSAPGAESGHRAAYERRLPGTEAMLPESQVKDRFFAYVVGLVARDIVADIPKTHLSLVLSEYAADKDIPFQKISRIDRSRVAARKREFRASFEEPLDFPIPFRILGLRVGSVKTTESVMLTEELVGRASYRNASGEDVTFDSVHRFRMAEGTITVDFRGWIDVILGRFVDDVDVVLGLVFRHDGTWYALLAGESPEGRIHAGGYNFEEDSGMLPVPDRFAGIANRLARQLTAPSPE
jgi:hypothetical protein